MPLIGSELKVVPGIPEDPSSYPAAHFEFVVSCPVCSNPLRVHSRPRSLKPLLEVKRLRPDISDAVRDLQKDSSQYQAERAIVELRHLLSALHQHWICQNESCGAGFALTQSAIRRVEADIHPKLSREWLSDELKKLGIDIPECPVT